MRKLFIGLILVFMVLPGIAFSATYTKQQVKSAQKVMANVNKLARVSVDGSMLVVEFHNYLFPYDVNKRLDFVRAVADADCVLNSGPRSIYFYDPGNKQIAQADRLNGVRLK